MVADDPGMYRDGLSSILNSQSDLKVVGTADTAADAASLVKELRPDVVLIGWPASSAASQKIFNAVQDSRGATRIIMLVSGETREDFVEAVRQGCCGLVPKQTSTEMLLKSVRKVHAGEFWLDRMTTADVIRKLAKKASSSPAPAVARGGVREQSATLSQREREIVSLVAQGFKNREMAERMFISEQTVKNHLHNIFDKLGVSDRLELALYAIHHNLHDLS
jgi:DNA-binding NarL/FixJ family response regulator